MLNIALPEVVSWEAPVPGGWARNFRLGEWLGDPVTPLFATWAVPAFEESFWAEVRRVIGIPPRKPPYVIVNGWYFASMNWWPRNRVRAFWHIIRHPRWLRIAAQFFPSIAKRAAAPWIREWHDVALPRYRDLVADGERRVDQATQSELLELVEAVIREAGRYFVSIGLLAGGAYRTEFAFAEFYRRHLAPRIGGSHQQLLCGLAGATSASHFVLSIDWVHPTLGEITQLGTVATARHAQAESIRQVAETQARLALSGDSRMLRRFERLLQTCQSYAKLREEVIGSFTLGWPLMRRVLIRLAVRLREAGLIANTDDIFFITYEELRMALTSTPIRILSGFRESLEDRRIIWNRQRSLAPPLTLGTLPPFLQVGFTRVLEALSYRGGAVGEGIRGLAVSPGKASGPARIIRGGEEFSHVQLGDVLVAPATAPAWSPLFARVVAVVTDTGSPMSHTSIVAREYGIPAVVATGDATARLRDGQIVTVDGNEGVVFVQ